MQFSVNHQYHPQYHESILAVTCGNVLIIMPSPPSVVKEETKTNATARSKSDWSRMFMKAVQMEPDRKGFVEQMGSKSGVRG